MKLPVTLVLPTYNCAATLEAHLDAIAPVLDRVAAAVAVDSASDDGTREILERRFVCPGARIFETEKNLYQSWNRGVELAETPYVYFSTVGETVSVGGLEEMVRLAESARLEVLITIPEMQPDAASGKTKVVWPVHRIEPFLAGAGELFLPDCGQRTLLSRIFLPASIIGSSASNLYATAALRDLPFPADKGHAGDVYWCLDYLPRLTTGISRSRPATFCYDGTRGKSWERLHAEMRALFEHLEGADASSAPADPFAAAVSRCIAEDTLRKLEHLARQETAGGLPSRLLDRLKLALRCLMPGS